MNTFDTLASASPESPPDPVCPSCADSSAQVPSPTKEVKIELGPRSPHPQAKPIELLDIRNSRETALIVFRHVAATCQQVDLGLEKFIGLTIDNQL